MNNLFNAILQLSISASVLTIIVIVLRGIMKNKLPKLVIYIMWILVFAKFIMPIDFSSPIDIWRNNEIIIPNISHEQKIEVPTPAILDDKATPIQTGIVNPTENIAMQSKSSISTIIWTCGMATALVTLLLMYLLTNKRYKYAEIVTSDYITKILENNNIKVKVYKDKNTLSPMVLGIVNPKIILPIDFDLDNNEVLSYILLHEIEHIKWKDNLTNILSLIILSIHWFNPLIWINYYLFNKDIEIFCDERVMKKIGKGNKSKYANVLLSCAINSRKILPTHICSFGESNIKQRIKRIIKYKKAKPITILASILIIIGIIFAFSTNGTNNDQEQTERTLYIMTADDNAPFGTEFSRGKQSTLSDKELIALAKEMKGYNFNNMTIPKCVELHIFDDKPQEINAYLFQHNKRIKWEIDKNTYKIPIPQHTGEYVFLLDIKWNKNDMETICFTVKIDTKPESSSDVINVAAPTIYPDQKLGIDGFLLRYASKDIIIFYGYMGLFVYDLNSESIIRSIDFLSLDTDIEPPDIGHSVSVSKDGKTVYIYPHPLEKYDMYIYEVKPNLLYKSEFKEMKDVFNSFYPIESTDISTYNAVHFDDGSKGYIPTDHFTVKGTKYITDDKEYDIFDDYFSNISNK